MCIDDVDDLIDLRLFIFPNQINEKILYHFSQTNPLAPPSHTDKTYNTDIANIIILPSHASQ